MNSDKTSSWSDEEHFNFYESLKELNSQERSQSLLNKATQLLETASDKDQDLLKAAESILTYWLLNNEITEDQDRAHTLLYQVYMRMGESEKARAFRR
ncbi:MAG: hypothetical protein U5L96_18780 [Owenweeksia sp.]|nr:hypothetical protein [Owenweeksia sp.]